MNLAVVGGLIKTYNKFSVFFLQALMSLAQLIGHQLVLVSLLLACV